MKLNDKTKSLSEDFQKFVKKNEMPTTHIKNCLIRKNMTFTINKITNFKHRKISVSNPQLFMSKHVVKYNRTTKKTEKVL